MPIQSIVRRISCCLLSFFFVQTCFAQNEIQKQAISCRLNFINHEFPFNQKLAAKKIHTFGVDFAYQRHLHRFFNIAIPLKLGKVDYFEADNTNSSQETISYMALDALIQFKPLPSDIRFSPYLFTGLGLNLEEFTNPSALVPIGLGLKIKLNKQIACLLYTSPSPRDS